MDLNKILMIQAENDKLKKRIEKMKYLNIVNDKKYHDLDEQYNLLMNSYKEVYQDSKAKGQTIICLRNNNTKLSVDLEHSEKFIKEIEKEFSKHEKECNENLELMKELSAMNEELAKQLKQERKEVERLKFLAGETTKKIEKKKCGCSVYDACIH